MNFVHFCYIVDDKCVQLGCMVLGRLEMEAHYTQFLLKKFDEFQTTDLTMKAILRNMLKRQDRLE